jgi:hypothetical protein
LNFLVVLSHKEPLTIELSEMLSGVLRETLAKTYGVSRKVFDAIPTKVVTIGGVPTVEQTEKVVAGAAD